MLDPTRPIIGLADSKKLQARDRERLALEIKQSSLAWAIAWASVEEIDRMNILRASLLAMKRAVESLSIPPSEVLVDGIHCPDIAFPVTAIIKGDATIASISAASILAKTARDALMVELHAQFPRYGFDRHKGYPTDAHLQALRVHGVSPVHRRSFAPVRALG
jgi:ribonuclease HII